MTSSSNRRASSFLRRLRNLFRKRKTYTEPTVTIEKPASSSHQYVPKHAASSHLTTTSPMAIGQRMEASPGSMPSTTGAQHQPSKTLAEQAEEMRARWRHRTKIEIGGLEGQSA
ncbi:MAG: hypothetical protein M1830_006810 [Pleopsidium flavum]|nr:MAG: hypothetical protein M1830_006810 [Pleopsidium flavum]